MSEQPLAPPGLQNRGQVEVNFCLAQTSIKLFDFAFLELVKVCLLYGNTTTYDTYVK